MREKPAIARNPSTSYRLIGVTSQKNWIQGGLEGTAKHVCFKNENENISLFENHQYNN